MEAMMQQTISYIKYRAMAALLVLALIGSIIFSVLGMPVSPARAAAPQCPQPAGHGPEPEEQSIRYHPQPAPGARDGHQRLGRSRHLRPARHPLLLELRGLEKGPSGCASAVC